MIKEIDRLGRVVIPMEIRRNLHIKDNDKLKVEVKNDSIILTKEDKYDLEGWLIDKIENEMDTMKRFAFKEVLEMIK